MGGNLSIKLDLKSNAAAQDIRIIMKEKELSAQDVVVFAVNRDMHQKILKQGYASIALDLWGHDNPGQVWDTLAVPVVDLKFDKLQERLIEDISEKQNVDYETAICYFLIFTMDSLGYHI